MKEIRDNDGIRRRQERADKSERGSRLRTFLEKPRSRNPGRRHT